MKLSPLKLILLLLIAGFVLSGEEVIYHEKIGVCSKITVPIAPDYFTPEELKSGEVTLFVTAVNDTADWTIHGKYDPSKGLRNLYLTDGENETGLDPQPTSDHFGQVASGHPLKLHFKLPAKAAENGVELVVTQGLFGMGSTPKGPYSFEVWKGVRLTEPNVTSKVDKLRNFTITVNAGGEGLKYKYEIENGRTSNTTSTIFRGRIPAGKENVKVKITVMAPDGKTKTVEVNVKP